MTNKAHSLKQESDYEPFIFYEEQEVAELFETRMEFTDAIEKEVNETE